MFPQYLSSWTSDEKIILHLWASGKTREEIVQSLAITETKYTQQRMEILRKMNTSTEAGAVAYALANGLITFEIVPSSHLMKMVRSLTIREVEVLCTLAEPAMQGETLGNVAREMNIAQGTLKKHLERVYEKLGRFGITNRTSATCLGIQLAAHRQFISGFINSGRK